MPLSSKGIWNVYFIIPFFTYSRAIKCALFKWSTPFSISTSLKFWNSPSRTPKLKPSSPTNTNGPGRSDDVVSCTSFVTLYRHKGKIQKRNKERTLFQFKFIICRVFRTFILFWELLTNMPGKGGMYCVAGFANAIQYARIQAIQQGIFMDMFRRCNKQSAACPWIKFVYPWVLLAHEVC